MAALDRKVLMEWPVNDVEDLASVIGDALSFLSEEDEEAYVSFVLVTRADVNVCKVRLVSIDLSDSFAHELEFA